MQCPASVGFHWKDIGQHWKMLTKFDVIPQAIISAPVSLSATRNQGWMKIRW